jgi:hypothetical protein
MTGRALAVIYISRPQSRYYIIYRFRKNYIDIDIISFSKMLTDNVFREVAWVLNKLLRERLRENRTNCCVSALSILIHTCTSSLTHNSLRSLMDRLGSSLKSSLNLVFAWVSSFWMGTTLNTAWWQLGFSYSLLKSLSFNSFAKNVCSSF